MWQRMLSPKWYTHMWACNSHPQDGTTVGDDIVWEISSGVATNFAFSGALVVGGLEFATTAPGGWRSALTANGSNSIAGAANFWDTAKEPGMIVSMATDSNVIGGLDFDHTNKHAAFGFKLTDDPNPATDDDEAIWGHSPPGEDHVPWRHYTSVAGVDYTSEWGIPTVAWTPYHMAILLDANRRPHYYFNSQFVGRGPALRDLTTLVPMMSQESLGPLNSTDMFANQVFLCQRWEG
jgi:hypothetical protein